MVFFDICSSTLILEDLLASENGNIWRDFILTQKKYLFNKKKVIDFDIYKFLGDGWILLFPVNTSGDELLYFMRDICKEFKRQYRKVIRPILSTSIHVRGINFGVDKGTLIYMKMNKQKEYIGRPLNIAARLQGSIKDKDKKPQYKALVSNNVFNNFHFEERAEIKTNFTVMNVKRVLRNISGGSSYLCKKITLIP